MAGFLFRVTGLFPPQRFAFASSLSSALRNGMSRHSYWHAISSAAKIRWSGPAGHGYLSTRPLCLPELCGAAARWVVVSVQGIKPGHKKGLAPAKRSLCFFGRLSPHAGRIDHDGLKLVAISAVRAWLVRLAVRRSLPPRPRTVATSLACFTRQVRLTLEAAYGCKNRLHPSPNPQPGRCC